MEETCPKCGSERWMTGLHVLSDGGLTLAVKRPTWTGEARGSSRTLAEACGECGYIEWFVTSPHRMWREWELQQRMAAARNRSNLPLPAAGATEETDDLPIPSDE